MVFGFILVPLANMLGFGSLGVGAGTAAAWYQSTFLGGYISSGSLFASFQSIAMMVWLF